MTVTLQGRRDSTGAIKPRLLNGEMALCAVRGRDGGARPSPLASRVEGGPRDQGLPQLRRVGSGLSWRPREQPAHTLASATRRGGVRREL